MQIGIEEELYKDIDFKKISYSELLEKAQRIIEEKNKTNEKEIKNYTTKQVQGKTEEKNGSVKINEFGEIIRDIKEINSEEINIDQLNIAQAEAIDYDELMGNNEEKVSVNVWLNRYNKLYNAIDKVPENKKSKYMLMQEDIVSTIKNKAKEQTRNKDENIQTQDNNER